MGRPSNDQRKRLAVEIAGGKKLDAAAEAAGLPTVTAVTLRKDPAFVNDLRAAQAEIIDGTLGAIIRSSNKAVEALEELLEDSDPQVKLKAATALLDKLLKLPSVLKTKDEEPAAPAAPVPRLVEGEDVTKMSSEDLAKAARG